MAVKVQQIKWQVEKHGKKQASWYCFWTEPDGSRRNKSFGSGKDGKRLAELYSERVRAQIALGQYDSYNREQTTWEDFVQLYDGRTLSRKAAATRRESIVSLNHFARILKLDAKPLSVITTARVEDFVSKRSAERGKQPSSKVTPATINKDLRMVKAAIRKAYKWKLITELPEFEFVRELEKLPTYVKPEHFTAVYKACNTATMPAGVVDPPACGGQQREAGWSRSSSPRHH